MRVFLEELFVLSSGRGKGSGKALLQYLAQIAEERDRGRLKRSCLDWNRPNIDFYLSLGAGKMDCWTTYRLEGATLEPLAT